MAMIRKQIYLDAETDREIKREAKRRRVSEAAVIRERLRHPVADQVRGGGDPKAREELRRRFRWVQREAKKYRGKGLDLSFDREELYRERLDRQSPR